MSPHSDCSERQREPKAARSVRSDIVVALLEAKVTPPGKEAVAIDDGTTLDAQTPLYNQRICTFPATTCSSHLISLVLAFVLKPIVAA